MITAMDWFCKCKTIYVPAFVSFPVEDNGKYSLALTESDPEAKLKRITISNVPENTVLLNLQEYSKLNIGASLGKIIRDDSGIFKCCDYLLISADSAELDFIYIELKSKKIDRHEIIKQFNGASCFMEYCKGVVEYFFDAPITKPVSIRTSYALLSWTSLNKTPTSPSRTKKNKYRKSLSPGDYIHQKIGGSGTISFKWFITAV